VNRPDCQALPPWQACRARRESGPFHRVEATTDSKASRSLVGITLDRKLSKGVCSSSLDPVKRGRTIADGLDRLAKRKG